MRLDLLIPCIRESMDLSRSEFESLLGLPRRLRDLEGLESEELFSVETEEEERLELEELRCLLEDFFLVFTSEPV